MVSRIQIRGYGLVNALGHSASEVWSGIEQHTVSTKECSSPWFPGGVSAPCFVASGDDALFRARLSEAGVTLPNGSNRTLLLALTAVEECLRTALIGPQEIVGRRVGVAIGTTVGCTFNNEEYYRLWRKAANPEPGPLKTYLQSNLAAVIQTSFGLQGPRAVLTNACSSATDAIGLAGQWIEAGLCDFAIAGGADELSRIACHGFNSLMLVSKENCTPYGSDRKGLNLGEGAGVLLLSGDDGSTKVGFEASYGAVLGYGAAADGYHPTAPHPEGRGLQDALRQAMALSGIPANELAMINGHGTGTVANDRAETKALRACGLEDVPLVSTKGSTGHTLGAAGGVEAVLTLLSLRKTVLHGTIGCRVPDQELGCAVLGEGKQLRLVSRYGISQSLAFGGGNAVLVMEGY